MPVAKERKRCASQGARIKALEQDLAEIARLREQAVAQRNTSRAEIVILRADLEKATSRLEASLFAMVLMQGQVRAHVARELQAQAQKAMGGDTVSLAG